MGGCDEVGGWGGVAGRGVAGVVAPPTSDGTHSSKNCSTTKGQCRHVGCPYDRKWRHIESYDRKTAGGCRAGHHGAPNSQRGSRAGIVACHTHRSRRPLAHTPSLPQLSAPNSLPQARAVKLTATGQGTQLTAPGQGTQSHCHRPGHPTHCPRPGHPTHVEAGAWVVGPWLLCVAPALRAQDHLQQWGGCAISRCGCAQARVQGGTQGACTCWGAG